MAYTKNYTQKTSEELDVEKADMLKRVKDIADGFTSKPEELAELLAFHSKFHNYSVNNTMLIYNQNPYANFIGSYVAFNKMNYSVNKGEKSIKILVPQIVTLLKIDDAWVQLSKATKSQQEQATVGLIKSRQITKFKLGSVFDISQTNCPKEDYPKHFDMGYSSEQHDQVFQGLVNFCNEYCSCEVKLENYKSIVLRGAAYRNQNLITINSLLEDTQKVSTLTHEIGHSLMHHDNSAEKKPSCQVELEADAYSVMLQSHLGIEITDTRKCHLADHYKMFLSYLEINKDKENLPSLDDVLKDVNMIYKNTIEVISKSINNYINTSANELGDEEDNEIEI